MLSFLTDAYLVLLALGVVSITIVILLMLEIAKVWVSLKK